MFKRFLKISVISDIFILVLFINATEAVRWNCYENGTTMPVDIDEVSGLWYEIARFPPSKMPACLSIDAPHIIENDEYVLHLMYVNNLNNKWKRMDENISFPWNEQTQSGLFNLTFSGGNINVEANFKYLGTFGNYTLVCGYAGISSGITILRLLSRNAIVTSDLKTMAENLLTNYGINSDALTWVEQGPRCNGSSSLASTGFIGFLALFGLMKIINCKR